MVVKLQFHYLECLMVLQVLHQLFVVSLEDSSFQVTVNCCTELHFRNFSIVWPCPESADRGERRRK
eukprot:c40140_g1_i1 orf=3-197(-)